ncbi:MAG: OmpA family protein [Alcanivorax sp.]|nr:OmpA family protein [Alcanivorax sp.]
MTHQTLRLTGKHLLAAVFTLALATTHASAHEIPDEYGYVGGHISQYWFDTDKISVKEATLPGIQAGVRFNENWSAQIWWERNNVVRDTPGPRTYAGVALLSVRHHFNNTSLIGFEPYAGLAAGQIRFDRQGSNVRHEQELVGLEFGAQRRLSEHWILDLGARPMRAASRNALEGEIYAALNFVIGGRQQPAPEPAPPVDPRTIDSDGDGVPDYRDECPDTPANVTVDEVGCPLDSDGDGVPDYLDQCPDTPAGAIVDEQGCQVYLERDVRETLYVEFELNRAVLRQEYIAELGLIAHMMRQYPDASLLLEGHTDSTGAVAYNEQLSAQRADAVKDALVTHYDVDPARITTEGKGPAVPIADNSTAEGRAQNRRVEAILRATAREAAYE